MKNETIPVIILSIVMSIFAFATAIISWAIFKTITG